MSANIYSVDYYYTTVEDKPGQGCRFLKMLASEEVNLIAFNAFPVGRDRTQLVIYPLNATWLGDVARQEGLRLVGPHHAFIVHGDDELGALVRQMPVFGDRVAIGGEDLRLVAEVEQRLAQLAADLPQDPGSHGVSLGEEACRAMAARCPCPDLWFRPAVERLAYLHV